MQPAFALEVDMASAASSASESHMKELDPHLVPS
ncbi:hypothetical protein F443_22094 [Phytophthora nicotianae P1569]|uniref:Uncharacterized protein n=1 Tax=Phytophthora nicotianae P1569 TaxID=1317065 RepID=V9DVK3_PHYNI|nr:hypothetical protein F443_22094 [Phytophthora nicotianae P1569]